MKVFGPLAPEHMTHVPVPLGAECSICSEPIAEGDSGYIQPHVTFLPDDTSKATVTDRAIHRECFLRKMMGSVGHQMHMCSCFGGTYCDPPGMTQREAAKQAVEFWEATHGYKLAH